MIGGGEYWNEHVVEGFEDVVLGLIGSAWFGCDCGSMVSFGHGCRQ